MHAYAARGGRYRPITQYCRDKNGNLSGKIELPMAVGTIGGSIRTNPVAKTALRILGVKTAQELAQVMAAVGLAQNFAALRAIAVEGIQAGHMRLHSKNVAVAAGAKDEMIDKVAEIIYKEKKINIERAKEVLCEFDGGKKTTNCRQLENEQNGG
jgi:hydroxymethylglutaryl-CoA reductase